MNFPIKRPDIFPQSKPQKQPHFRSLPQFGCVARIVSYQKLEDKTWRRRVMNRERQVMKGGRVKGVDGERRPSGVFFRGLVTRKTGHWFSLPDMIMKHA
jgi:hypothetical protein